MASASRTWAWAWNLRTCCSTPTSPPTHQTLVRSLRTRAVTRKQAIENRPRIKSSTLDHAADVSPKSQNAPQLDTSIQVQPTTPISRPPSRYVHKGFPPEPRKSRPLASTPTSSKPSSPSSPTASKKQEAKATEKTTEKFPRKLAAFPFVPGATSTELTKAHRFFFLPADFVKSATDMDKIPDNTLIPEVAFIGRSNIGKSSLINGLVNRNGLVKTSSKPGHTRMMNFFKIGEKLSLVDMPGYGWKSRDEWGGMILDYLKMRKNLRRIYILIDPSHGLKESDQQIMKLLDSSGLSYQVVLTKMDRLSKTKYTAAKAEIEAELVKDAICCFPMVLGVSSKTKDGLDELRAAIVKAGQLAL
ncbi:MAG: P-loop containing nucleoside triphosphate hydrolase protein [Podila humilis]|nr:MAG: P-loop containing nucleoside triphosphate hydrolase protein [Podila humilis]